MFKPMLACSTIPQIEELSYPLMASPKLDGIRCLIVDGIPMTRSLKPIPNKHITRILSDQNLPDMDGELMVNGDFESVSSAIMSVEGTPDFKYVVFDLYTNPKDSYKLRFKTLTTYLQTIATSCVELVNNWQVRDVVEMQELYDNWLEDGYEGAIVRAITGPYKHGRSTLNQGWMLKLKPFDDAEAVIVGLEELMHNENEATLDNLGNTVRSHEQAGQVPGDTLGALVVTWKGKTFKIGSGFDSATRYRLWDTRIIGELVKFKHQGTTRYGIPRFPIYLGLRDKRDL